MRTSYSKAFKLADLQTQTSHIDGAISFKGVFSVLKLQLVRFRTYILALGGIPSFIVTLKGQLQSVQTEPSLFMRKQDDADDLLLKLLIPMQTELGHFEGNPIIVMGKLGLPPCDQIPIYGTNFSVDNVFFKKRGVYFAFRFRFRLGSSYNFIEP